MTSTTPIQEKVIEKGIDSIIYHDVIELSSDLHRVQQYMQYMQYMQYRTSTIREQFIGGILKLH